MALATTRINSIFKAFGVSLDAHAASNGETAADALARMSTEHDQDSLVASLLRKYPDQGGAFVTQLFQSRGLDIAKGSENEAQRIDRIVSELQTGRTFTELQTALDRQAAPPSTATAVGGTAKNTTSIVGSPTLKWYYDNKTGNWLASYQLPNSKRRIFFEATPEQMDGIFGDKKRPTNYQNGDITSLSKIDGSTFGGDLAEQSGTGSFEQRYQREVAIALDNGTLPSWAPANGEIMDIIWLASMEDKPTQWMIDEIAKTQEFKTRYKGIDAYIKGDGLSVQDAVANYRQFEGVLREQLVRIGRNPNEVTPELVGGLLAKGQSSSDVKNTFTTFQRYEQNASALASFNAVLAAQGKPPLNSDEQWDFLEGNAPADMYRIWEAASFDEAAVAAGLSLSTNEAISIANATLGEQNFDQAYEGLTNAARNILRYRGDMDLGRYRLDEQDLIDVAVGIAPRSGRTQAEVMDGMDRALSAARAGTDGPRANRFRQFGKEGTPQAISTSRSRTQE